MFAVAPFNFTAIAGNLSTAPALMGNTVVLKPASTAVYSAYFLMKMLEEAGLPPGVINMVLGSGSAIGDRGARAAPSWPASTSPARRRCSRTCGGPWATTSRATGRIRGSSARPAARTSSSPIPSADPDAVATAIVRGSFEYQGQKCSAASRVYAPVEPVAAGSASVLEEDVTGDRRWATSQDFRNFMGAVIDRQRRSRPRRTRSSWPRSGEAEVVVGGEADDSQGWFVKPTVVATTDPGFDLMQRELFGPVVTAYVYDEKRSTTRSRWSTTTSPYALTGSVFATDRARHRDRRTTRCATPPATSTSTTSRPVRWSASSRSAAHARPAPTTRPARCGT